MEQFPKDTTVKAEKKSGISRVVGVGPEDEQAILDFFHDRFKGNAFDERFEKKKSPELESLIGRINERMPEFLARYGGKALVVTADHIHILDDSKLSPEERERVRQAKGNTAMFYDSARQAIISYVDPEEYGLLKFSQSMVHEILHQDSFGSFAIASKKHPSANAGIAFMHLSDDGQKENVPFVARRMGLNMISADGEKKFLNDFDEALVNELAYRFDRDFFGAFPELAAEWKAREDFLSQVPEEFKERDADWRYISNVKTERNEDGSSVVAVDRYTYRRQMDMFNWFLDDVYSENKDQFSSREELFAFVARAGLTGKLLPFARLVEKTYGKGSFRIVSESTAERISRE